MNGLRVEVEKCIFQGGRNHEVDPGEIRFHFPPDFIGFSGHFPGHPVVPAIAQIRAVASLAETVSGPPLRLSEVRMAKFLSPIRPNEEVTVRYRRRVESGVVYCDATFRIDGKTASTIDIQLTTKEDAG